MDSTALFGSSVRSLLRNKLRSSLTVLGITIGIAAVICVVAIGKAGQARVEQHLANLGDNFVQRPTFPAFLNVSSLASRTWVPSKQTVK